VSVTGNVTNCKSPDNDQIQVCDSAGIKILPSELAKIENYI
jgi:hypothetical protein